jgi:hypothetical protein
MLKRTLFKIWTFFWEQEVSCYVVYHFYMGFWSENCLIGLSISGNLKFLTWNHWWCSKETNSMFVLPFFSKAACLSFHVSCLERLERCLFLALSFMCCNNVSKKSYLRRSSGFRRTTEAFACPSPQRLWLSRV